jgi:glyoxalase family protein
VPAERQVRGLDSARLWLRDLGASEALLAGAMGFERIGEERGWVRWGVDGGGSGARLELAARPDAPRGAWGAGAIHHLAFRVDDEAHQLALREAIAAAGSRPTPVIDRFWFRSVYFKEPGGVLFELATDGPGFAVDEPLAKLGETLVLPPWLEARRSEIEAAVPKLGPPAPASASPAAG